MSLMFARRRQEESKKVHEANKTKAHAENHEAALKAHSEKKEKGKKNGADSSRAK